jgi:predicted DNA repair protein MutK
VAGSYLPALLDDIASILDDDAAMSKVAAALSRDDIRVIPVLVSGDSLPRSEPLSDELKGFLARRCFSHPSLPRVV